MNLGDLVLSADNITCYFISRIYGRAAYLVTRTDTKQNLYMCSFHKALYPIKGDCPVCNSQPQFVGADVTHDTPQEARK